MIINLSYVLNKFFLGACLLITTNLYSQDWETKEKTYTEGIMLYGIIDVDTNKVISLKPYAKKVTVKYDPFFYSYVINFETLEGNYMMKLVTKRELSSGITTYVDTYSKNPQIEYLIEDKIKSDGSIIITALKAIVIDGKNLKPFKIIDELK
ncbi:hypothetical protein [Flavobacterium sp.]|uniref:hypothetical protein n=1 Tax=Flavobacterium sp. TaxID=239 RepID=UPI003D26759C